MIDDHAHRLPTEIEEKRDLNHRNDAHSPAAQRR
jgi:hypothetical protein